MEHEKIAPFHRLTRCFCMNRPVLFKCTGLVVAFRLLCFGMPISQRQRGRRHMAEKFILTHTHEMSYMRCFKDIATAGTGLVDAEAVQPEYHAFLAQQEFIRAKGGLDLHGVLANVCRPVMETVQFCHLENLEKIGRKSGMETTCGTF